MRVLAVGVDTHRSHAAVRTLGACPMRTPTTRQLTLAADRCEAVVNLAPLPPPPRSSLAKLANIGATRRALRLLNQLDQALNALELPRLVQRSSVSLYPDRRSRWIDEDCPTMTHRRSRLCERAEQIAATHGERRHSVVLRFGHPWGAEDPATRAWLLAACNGYQLLDLTGDTYWPTIHVADAAQAISAALTAPAGTYNVAEPDPQPFHVVAEAVAHAVGRNRLHPLPPTLSRADARLYSRSHRVDSAALHRATGCWPARRLTANLRDDVTRWLQPNRLSQGWATDVPW